MEKLGKNFRGVKALPMDLLIKNIYLHCGPNPMSRLKPHFCVAGPRKINILEKYRYLLSSAPGERIVFRISGMRNCARDEGRPLEAGLQGLASNHLKLLWLRVRVVSVKESHGLGRWKVWIRETSNSEPLMRHRKDRGEVRTELLDRVQDELGGDLLTAQVASGVKVA